jgi:hypothetical protein
MIEVHWLAAGAFLRVSGVLLVSVLAVGIPSANFPANGKKRPVLEEMIKPCWPITIA